MRDLIDLMHPRYIEVTGLFMPRGGISIHPFANWGDEAHQALVAERMAQAMAAKIAAFA